METYCLYFGMLMLVMANTLLGFVAVTASGAGHLKSDGLRSQCSKCDTSSQCPASEAYPHMTGYDDSLIAGALQSDYVISKDTGIYLVPNIKGGESDKYNAYYGWESTSGSASGYHRFRNYMDKCSGGQSYLTVDKNGRVSLRSSGKCLTVSGGKKEKRTMGVADCNEGSFKFPKQCVSQIAKRSLNIPETTTSGPPSSSFPCAAFYSTQPWHSISDKDRLNA
ncbi:unnamed protein product [Camellia sinensis]